MKASVIKELISLNVELHENFTGALVSDRSLALRSKLLSFALLAYAISWGGLMPKEIPLVGITVDITNQGFLYFGLALIILYLFMQFWWRAEMEFLNIKNKRRSYVLYLEAKKKELLDSIIDSDNETKIFFENFDFLKEDEYRKNSSGTSLKAQWNELYLPAFLSAGAAFSCLYKGFYIVFYN